MVLSIGMIVKNEEKYLEKCLTALQPIFNELDSELIIADTGSTDRTVEIAKKFTDNVFHFEWINDFAAARNSTLEKAQGEWYMFLDADEVIQDCKPLIHFFKSGEYLQYMSADYTIRSYTDEMDMNVYVDSHNLRLSKNYEGIKFVRPIHEQLASYTPTKSLDVIFDHYGYLYHNNGQRTELAQTKTDRNLDYLFKMLDSMSVEEIEELDFHLYDQIADCYEVKGDLEKALEYIDMGLEKLDHKNSTILAYYIHKISIICYTEDFDRIIALADEYFDTSVNPWNTKDFASNCMMYARRGYAYYKKKQYDKAVDDYAKFIDIYGRYKKGRLDKYEDRSLTIWKMGSGWVMTSFDVFFRCCYAIHKYELAERYARAIDLGYYKGMYNVIDNHLRIRVEVMEEVGYKNLDYLFGQLDSHGKAFLLSLVRGKMEKSSLENRKTVTKKLSVLGKTNTLASIYYEYLDKGSVAPKRVEDFLTLNGTIDGEDLLFILLEQQNDITPFVLTRDFFADRTVQIALNNYPDCIKLFENYDINNISDEGLEKATSLYGWVQLRAMERGIPIAKIFEMYGKLGVRWYDEFESDNMPDDIRAALLVNNVCAAHAQLDKARFTTAINELRDGVSDLDPVITAYFNEVKGDFAQQNDPAAQLAALAVQVKESIRSMISAGDINEAQSTLGELAALCPNDPELDVLEKEISEKR